MHKLLNTRNLPYLVAAGAAVYLLARKGLPMFGNATVNLITGMTTPAAIWGVDYLNKGFSLDSLRGNKPWPMNWKTDPLQPPAVAEFQRRYPRNGALFQQGAPPIASGVAAGQKGVWTPDGIKLTYAGQPATMLRGDVRALYTLGVLCMVGGVTHLDHLGMAVLYNGKVARPGQKEFGHGYGYAIDITSDVTMNKLIAAATKLHCPIGWISAQKGQSGWPMFQLREKNGQMEKVRVGQSNVNHSNPYHYHLMLPRPIWATEQVDAVNV